MIIFQSRKLLFTNTSVKETVRILQMLMNSNAYISNINLLKAPLFKMK